MDEQDLKVNTKIAISNSEGHLLMFQRTPDAPTAPGKWGLGGCAYRGESDIDAAARLIAERVGLRNLAFREIDRWIQTGDSETSVRVLYTATTDATTADLSVDVVQSAAFFAIDQVQRIARTGGVTDSTLVALCRLYPQLIPSIPAEPKAVIVDGIGTITNVQDEQQRAKAAETMAEILGVSQDVYETTLRSMEWSILSGRLGGTADVLKHLCTALESRAYAQDLPRLVRTWKHTRQSGIGERFEAESTLAALATRGYRIGLAANGTEIEHALISEMLSSRWIDYPVWSAATGLTQPNPALLRSAARNLGVPPASCVYVSHRVHGLVAAAAAGMAPIQLANGNTAGLSDAWPVVDTLDQIPSLLP